MNPPPGSSLSGGSSFRRAFLTSRPRRDYGRGELVDLVVGEAHRAAPRTVQGEPYPPRPVAALAGHDHPGGLPVRGAGRDLGAVGLVRRAHRATSGLSR